MRRGPGRLRIVIAPDSFKGSMTALEAACAIERGLRKAMPDIATVKVPMADGGEGTARAIVEASGGRFITRTVSDPLGRPVRAAFGVAGDGKTAVVEMAAASGLTLLSPSERNPLKTTTRGTGELILCALGLGVTRIIAGLGGSATVDGGAGMASALGVRFLDRAGHVLPHGGGALSRLRSIDCMRQDPRLKSVEVIVACDVTNPLTGRHGASRVYGPQKGATPAMVRELDAGLAQLAKVISRDLGKDVLHTPGSGAAGGLGAGLIAFLNARLERGVELVMETVELEKHLADCHLVITGEGRMDGQTAFGKTAAGVARAAKQRGIPVIAICGSLGKDVRSVLDIGIDAYFSALQEPLEERQLRGRGKSMLEDCAEQVGRLLTLACGRAATI